MSTEKCPVCGGALREAIQIRHRHGAVLMVERSVCESDMCDWEGVNPDQSRRNKKRIVAARERYVEDIMALIRRSEHCAIAIGHFGFSVNRVHPDRGRGSIDMIETVPEIRDYVTDLVRELATRKNETAQYHIDVVRPGVILRR